MESKLPNTISKGHGSPSVPKSKKSDDMSNILDTATRIFDQYMEKWPLVVFEATDGRIGIIVISPALA
jgi:hypothetical protein